MRFLVDESADARVAGYLRGLGHDAATVAGDFRPGLSDEEVLALAQRDQRILITDDADFGELVFVRRLPHAGVIYFRLGATDFRVRIGRLGHVLAHHADHLDQFLVVTRHRVQVRRADRS